MFNIKKVPGWKIIVKVYAWIVLLFTGKWLMADEIYAQNVVDYSGQGRDRYGH